MKKYLIFIMVICIGISFCACGSSETPSAIQPANIQFDDTEEGPVFSVIYDIDNQDTEQWSGYDSKELEVQTAIDGIKACMGMDEWSDDAVVFGYAKEPLLKNMLYSYGMDGDYTGIAMYQIGIYNDTYTLEGELD